MPRPTELSWACSQELAAAPSPKSDGITIISAILGALLGHQAGAEVRKHEVIYRLARAYRGAPLELVPVNGAKAPTIGVADWLAPARTDRVPRCLAGDPDSF